MLLAARFLEGGLEFAHALVHILLPLGQVFEAIGYLLLFGVGLLLLLLLSLPLGLVIVLALGEIKLV